MLLESRLTAFQSIVFCTFFLFLFVVVYKYTGSSYMWFCDLQGAKGATLRGFEAKYRTFMFFDTEHVRDGKKRLYILGPKDGRRAALAECESAVSYKMSGNGSLRSWFVDVQRRVEFFFPFFSCEVFLPCVCTWPHSNCAITFLGIYRFSSVKATDKYAFSVFSTNIFVCIFV